MYINQKLNIFGRLDVTKNRSFKQLSSFVKTAVKDYLFCQPADKSTFAIKSVVILIAHMDTGLQTTL